MRILLLSGVYPPQIGGPSEQTRQIAGALSERGHEVLVITRGEPRDERAGFRIRCVGGDRHAGLVGKVRGNVWVFREIAREIVAFRPQVVHAQTADYLALYAVVTARRLGVPTLLKYAGSTTVEGLSHGADAVCQGRLQHMRRRTRRAFLRARERLVLGLFDRVWVTTPTYARDLEATFAVPPRKLWLHPNFIALEPFAAIARERDLEGVSFANEDAEVRLLMVSRLKPHKGVHLAIEALARLPDEQYTLQIVGDGPPEYEKYLRERARALGVSHRVVFRGAVPPDQVASVYRSSDLFLLPSYEEAFGIVLLEAMAAGVPVVASRVGGIPDVVEDGVSGKLVPPGDPEALARAIWESSADPGQRKLRTATAREHAARFSLEQGIGALTDRYEQLVRS